MSTLMPQAPMAVVHWWVIFRLSGRKGGVDISVKPVVMAAALWGGLWQGQHVCFHSGNMAVISLLHTKTAKFPML